MAKFCEFLCNIFKKIFDHENLELYTVCIVVIKYIPTYKPNVFKMVDISTLLIPQKICVKTVKSPRLYWMPWLPLWVLGTYSDVIHDLSKNYVIKLMMVAIGNTHIINSSQQL